MTENKIPSSFGTDSLCNKIIKVRNSLTHSLIPNLSYIIPFPYQILSKSDMKMFFKCSFVDGG